MPTILVALLATGVSAFLAARAWPRGVDGTRKTRRDVPRQQQADVLVYPVVCLLVGAMVSGPGILAEGTAAFVAAGLVALSLGTVLLIQVVAIRKARRGASSSSTRKWS